jgi:hypothetical protein
MTEQEMERAAYDQGYQHGWDAAVRLAAQIAEARHGHWNSTPGHGVSCDATACEDIADAIRVLKGK